MLLDAKRLAHEMRLLAEERTDEIAGEGALLLTKQDAAKICGRSKAWLDLMIAIGRLPTVKVGRANWIQRPVLIEVLVRGM
jgi:hypothetical protein